MSFTVTLILVLIAVIITMGGIIFVLVKSARSKKKEIADLYAKLSSARVNIEQLSKYVDKLQKIKSEEKSISNKIKEAKTDEEVFKIIADIVADNNNRVQND